MFLCEPHYQFLHRHIGLEEVSKFRRGLVILKEVDVLLYLVCLLAPGGYLLFGGNESAKRLYVLPRLSADACALTDRRSLR